MSSLSAFRVTIETVEEACLVRVGGELDRTAANELREHLRNARGVGSTTLVDLANVSFIDSAGLRVLVGESEAAAVHGRATFVVRPSWPVRRLVKLMGCGDRLVVVPSAASLSLLGDEPEPEQAS